MGYKVIFSAQSNRDLGRVVGFLAQKNPAAAERLGHAVVNHALSLGTMPHVGKLVRERPGMRRVPHLPWFLIYYRADDVRQVVEIARVWDGRQNPSALNLS